VTWVWGVVNALLIMLVIHCNGQGWRAGWALGFAAQCWLILFGALGAGPWTFMFSTGPAIMFAVNWWLHPRRVARRLAADAAIVRAAVAASHEQPSPVLNARLGVSGEEALANIDKFLRGFHATITDPPPYPYGRWVAKRPLPPPYGLPLDVGWMPPRQPTDDEQPVTTPPPGMSTDIMPTGGHLASTPADPPSGCLICPTDVPQTELIDHLISHHPAVYDGTPFETWPVDDVTDQESDKP